MRTPTTLLAAALIALPLGAQPQAATGIVYHDRNANQRHDTGEPGIPGVRVTNSVDVVLTDNEGRYQIPVTNDTIVSVIKPAGFATPRSPRHLPRFFYIHKPDGSPDDSFIFPGVEPTGPLPDSIDFPLREIDEPTAFEALFVSDPQPYTAEAVRMYADEIIARAVQDTNPAVAIFLGDLVGDDLDLFEPLIDAHAQLGVPIYHVYGNHDMNPMSPNDEHADETFERVFGPTDYAFQIGHVHFVVLDNVVWQGFDGYSRRLTPWTGYAKRREGGFPSVGNYVGGLSDDQLEFVRNVVRTTPDDHLIVLCTHIPLEHDDPASKHQVPRLDELMTILAEHPRSISFSGHTHMNRHWFLDSSHGFTQPADPAAFHHHHNVGTGSGSWWNGLRDVDNTPHSVMRCGTPKGFAVASFDMGEYTSRFHAGDPNHGDLMRITVPTEFAAGSRDTIDVVANIWAATGVRTHVHARLVDASDPRATSRADAHMHHTPMPDPAYAAHYEREESMRALGVEISSRSIPEPVVSHNIFTAEIPAPRTPGVYAVVVTATDMFGQTVTQRRNVHVTPAELDSLD